MPIISKLDVEPLEATQSVKYNFRAADWKDFRKALENKLQMVQLREENWIQQSKQQSKRWCHYQGQVRMPKGGGIKA